MRVFAVPRSIARSRERMLWTKFSTGVPYYNPGSGQTLSCEAPSGRAFRAPRSRERRDAARYTRGRSSGRPQARRPRRARRVDVERIERGDFQTPPALAREVVALLVRRGLAP